MSKDFADLRDWRHRFDAFAARFVERAGPRRDRPSAPPASSDEYWRSVQELFTRDVTQRELRELLEQDTTETFRFFTREVDLAALQGLPWYQRYPRAVWHVFLHMAFRLSPARRLLFAVAVPLLLLGWLRYLVSWFSSGWPVSLPFDWLLAAATLLFALLVLELKDKLTLKGDLEIARQIQFGLLPFEPLQRPGASVCASMRPANTVGGDYFDVVELADGRLAIAVGDVAGKGMPAALLMALLQGSLRTLITAGLRGPELVEKLNDHLCANIPTNRLVTLFYAEYEPETGELAYVNAGHNAPFLLRTDGPAERLAATGLALGILAGTNYEGRSVHLQPGERLFLYTDGATEANDPGEAEYGEERLDALLERGRALGDRELIDSVSRDVLAFCASERPRDDMTFMVLARPGGEISDSGH